MQFDIRPRQWGKTFDTVRKFKASRNAVLLVMNEFEAGRIRRQFALTENEASRVVSPTSLQRVRGRVRDPVMYIDNLEHVLPQLVGMPVAEVTASP